MCENGETILGESALVLNLPTMIGPGMNTHHHAYNSRGARYCPKDLIPAGYIDSVMVQGVRSREVLVSIKYAVFNDQEVNRSGTVAFMGEQEAWKLGFHDL